MKKSSITLMLITVSLIFTINSCKKENQKESNYETKNSTFRDNESHNMGQNCMNCHQQGGNGEGWFNVAGTIYDSTKTKTYPNTTVKLYSGPNGSRNLKYTLQVDEKGNFYTTDSIVFGNGLYPSVTGSKSTKYMSSSISTGQCYSCHGNTTDRIWAE